MPAISIDYLDKKLVVEFYHCDNSAVLKERTESCINRLIERQPFRHINTLKTILTSVFGKDAHCSIPGGGSENFNFCVDNFSERQFSRFIERVEAAEGDQIGLTTKVGLASASIGCVGLALIHFGAVSGAAVPCLWWLSLGLILIGSAAVLYAGIQQCGFFPAGDGRTVSAPSSGSAATLLQP